MPFDRASYTRERYYKRAASHDYARDWIKSCRLCGAAKSVREFYRLPSTADGYTHECKACRRQKTRERYHADIEASRTRARADERERERHRLHQAEERRQHPDKIRARKALNLAVLRGELARGTCETCGDPKTEGHHDDYAKPLAVRWLCRSCHRTMHRKYA